MKSVTCACSFSLHPTLPASLKVRRKVPSGDASRILLYDSGVAKLHAKIIRRQLLLTESFKALHLKASQRAHSLTGESPTSPQCVGRL